jgi:ribonuclease E
MPKVMLINVTHSEESRVGILNDRILESFEIESLSRAHLKGNIYKGVVHRIHPALEAAFVDIGAERDAFLPLDEVCFNNLDETPKPNGSESSGRSQLRIRDVLRPGQEILVQITKEQFANKPPTLSTFYSLPGRYLVLLPGSEDTGISRRIEGDERDRLRKIVDDLKPESGFGLIVRTVAGLEDNGRELTRDLEYLQRLWSNVQGAARGSAAPSLVYREHDIVQRAIRDFYTPDISEIYIDDEDVFQRAREFLRAIMPGSEAVLRLYRGEQPLFSAFSVEEQIESVFGRRVRLRSGGSIVIDGTEALTAIDVNSGGAVRGANPEETAFRTNREAAAEVARQLRLRDIGGIIVVDFIDMRDPKHIREIEQLMRTEMRLDKARHETGRLSSLGLMQISRQRLRPAAGATSHVTCPLCQGYGSVRTHGSAALGAIRKIHDRLSLGDVDRMIVTLPSEVGLYVLNQKREDLANLESRYESTVEIRLSEHLLPHEIETEVVERSRAVAPKKAIEPGAVAPAAEGGTSTDENGGKRRRRRRRKRPGAAAAEGGDTPAAAAAESGDSAAAAPADSAETTPAADTDGASEAAAAEGTEQAAPAAQGSGPQNEAASADGSARTGRGRRSRGRRGGRRRRTGPGTAAADAGESQAPAKGEAAASQAAATGESAASQAPARQEAPSSDRDRTPAPPAAAPPPPAPRPEPNSLAAEAAGRTPSPAAASADSPPSARAPETAAPAPATDASTAKPGSATESSAAEAKPKRAAAKKTTKKATTKRAAAKKTTKKAAAKKATSKKTTAKKAATKKAAATTKD